MSRNMHRVKRYKRRVKRRGKRNDATLWAVLFIVALWYCLIGRELLPGFFLGREAVAVSEESSLYEVPCTQANMAKLLACTLDEKETTGKQEDKSETTWYSSYYASLQQQGFKALNEKEALQLMDEQTLSKVLSEVVGEGYEVTATKSEANKDKHLSIHEVINTYYSAMNQVKKDSHMKYITLVILATPSDEQLGAWQVVTDQGTFGFKGLILEPLKNQTIQVAVKGQEILGVMKVISKESTIENCEIKLVTDQIVTAVVKGKSISFQNKGVDLQQEGSIGKLTISSEGAIAYEPEIYGEKDIVTKVTSNTITLEKAGVLNYKDVTISDKTDLGNYTSINQLPYGVQIAYQKEGNELVALQVIGRSNREGLRMVLANKEGSYVHKQVKLVSTAEYDLIYNGETSKLAPEEVWDSQTFNWSKEAAVVRLVPKGDTAMKLLTVNKSQGFPKYKGCMEITKVQDGYHIVNEVDMENYVAGVIPSEMPTSYGIEALKVQAIAARTYGVASKESSKFVQYGAQIDDTTASQVYNNLAPNPLAYEATAATEGKVLTYKGKLLSSKFFATSCGYTANYGEVWATGETFPSDTPPYMMAEKQYTGDKMVENMKEEKMADQFFKLTAADIDAFDENSPWFRWQVQLSQEEVSTLVNNAISKLANDYPALIKVKVGNEWKSQGVEGIGKIQNLQVAERGEGGNVMTLILKGSKATIKVSTEYVIRRLLGGAGNPGVVVTRSDGSITNPMSLLPSAFFVPDITYNNQEQLKQIVLYGGGFGHGVGMSQDGVRGMAEMGYTYDVILKHFYKNVEIVTYQ